jgi:hypothetical protein
MQKFKCTVCGRVHELKIDAVYCHPAIVQVWEKDLPDRTAELPRAPVQSEQKCPRCDGAGWEGVPSNQPIHDCPACNGTGISTRSDGG